MLLLNLGVGGRAVRLPGLGERGINGVRTGLIMPTGRCEGGGGAAMKRSRGRLPHLPQGTTVRSQSDASGCSALANRRAVEGRGKKGALCRVVHGCGALAPLPWRRPLQVHTRRGTLGSAGFESGGRRRRRQTPARGLGRKA